MPHITKHNKQIKVKSELAQYFKDNKELEQIDFKELCKTIALTIGVYHNYTFRNGDIWVNKATRKQEEIVLCSLDLLIYREKFMPKAQS